MNSKRRILIGLALTASLLLALALPASAGNPHFVEASATRVGDSLVVSGKEVGLGDEDQVRIVVSATAACINPGKKKPSAENKSDVSTGVDVPVQNGKAEFEIPLGTGDIDPDCSPPMTIEFSDVTITDVTNGVTTQIPGTF
jgi:hypothetical protein